MRASTEQGAATMELVAGLAVLLLPVVALLAVLPSWAEAASAAESAAAQAGRAAALGPDAATGVEAGVAAGEQVLANRGVRGEVTVEVEVDDAGAPVRHGVARTTAQVQLPVLHLPVLGPVGGLAVDRTHREPLDPWRGLDPDA